MVTFGQNVGDIATYMCTDGFYLRGNMTRIRLWHNNIIIMLQNLSIMV